MSVREANARENAALRCFETAYFDPRTRITPPPDVVERTLIETLARGPIFRIVRMVKGGPLCPSVILWVQTRVEPGQPDNPMDRSPFIAALVSGQPVAPYRLFSSGMAGTSHVTREVYERLMAEIAANLRANRYDPRCDPFKPVAIAALEIPFMEDARNARRHLDNRTRRRTRAQPAAVG